LITLGSPPKKGRQKKKKKNPGINLGQPAEEGRKKKNSAGSATENAARTSPAEKRKKKKNSAGSAAERHRTDRPVLLRNVTSDARTHRLSDLIYKIHFQKGIIFHLYFSLLKLELNIANVTIFPIFSD
jgi:hypothetical protein